MGHDLLKSWLPQTKDIISRGPGIKLAMSVSARCALIDNAAFSRLELDQHALGRCGTIGIPNLYFYVNICERSRIRPHLRPY